MPSKFRPCIDLHEGQVKQIVGGTLSENASHLQTNFVSEKTSGYYAELYQKHNLTGAHVIKLGPKNDDAALEAIKTWHKGLQVGGGINIENANYWLQEGAEKVIITSWLFPNEKFNEERLRRLVESIGKDQLVIDLSCRTKGNDWIVAMNKWQTETDTLLNEETVKTLADSCSEFLVHAADVEGLCKGIDERLVQKLGEWSPIPCTYAGGGKDISDLDLVNTLSKGKVDLTFGSALDIFGGNQVKFLDAVAWNHSHL
ncbi:5-proFAR isomerase His6 [Globomyces pollinis-pini]|nr:5-proFAR isomerase His6 [Globomyces pollinis-pini]